MTHPESLSVLLAGLDEPGVEEGDGSEEEPVGDVRQEEAERLLVSTAALAAGERGQQAPEVRRLTQDRPVDFDGDSLTAVEDQVSPPLHLHVLAHPCHHPRLPVHLASPRHRCSHSLLG